MLDIVPSIRQLWASKQDSLIQSANNIVEGIENSNLAAYKNSSNPLKDNIMKQAFDSFDKRFDDEYGGFKSSSKNF